MEINVDIIKELIESLNRSTFDSLKLETEQFKLSLERNAASAVSVLPAAIEVNTAAVAVEPKKPEQPAVQKGNILKSPIVGTFYSAASPEKPPFAKVGQSVKRGDTLYIVESMKLMNDITSEYDGTITEIFVQNAQPVEYGQQIMRIE
jgi:acetyl-CoA carboxylase biotin carboxyl carrier protein